MEIRDPELRQIIRDLNKDWSDSFAIIRDNYENDRWVELKNGDRKKVLMREAVAQTHETVNTLKVRIDGVCDIIQPLSDFAELHRIMKKYKLYWVSGIGGLGTLGATIFKIFTG